MKVYLFPGQGSQVKGMGERLFNDLPEFARLEKEIDNTLGYSIRELCLSDPGEKLGQTQYTQPALYVVNALYAMQKQVEDDRKPDFLAGHSLGEYNALLMAGVFDFITGLRLVKRRGELMSQVTDGGMLAVVGLSVNTIKACLNEQGVSSLDLANLNSPQQTIISGPKTDIEQMIPMFEAADAQLVQTLKVSAPFHSRYMNEAAQSYTSFLQAFEFNSPQTTVIANVTGKPYGVDSSSDSIKEMLIQQIDHPVCWSDSIRFLLAKGVSDFTEVGPGRVLSGLMRRIQREAKPLILETKAGTETQVGKQEKTTINTHSVDSKGEILTSETKKNVDHNCKHKGELGSANVITSDSLGSAAFKADYGLKYAYITGAMYKGIASKELVVAMGRAGMMGYLGTGGMRMNDVEASIQFIQRELSAGESFGMNLLCNIIEPELEEQMVDLYLRYNIGYIEAAAFMQITPSLVRYRLHGIQRQPDGTVTTKNYILAKVSRPEIASLFMQPAPKRIIDKLLEAGKITADEAQLAQSVSMSDDICVEADSGGHTDKGVAYALMPAMLSLRNDIMSEYSYAKPIRVGAAGGIGTPEAAAAAFILGAEFILTGSINQCTVEAGTSDTVKEMLQDMNVQDTAYAPAGDMFELGAQVQVLRRSVLFPVRANRLYALYQQYNSLDEIDETTKRQIQGTYFKRSFEDVWDETRNYYLNTRPEEVARAEKDAKHKMVLIFRWYFIHTNRLAMSGADDYRVDYQIHCGPAMGAFNQWVKGTQLEAWRNRHVDKIGIRLMTEAAALLNQRFSALAH